MLLLRVAADGTGSGGGGCSRCLAAGSANDRQVISSASYCHAAGGVSPQQHIVHDWGEVLTPHFMTAYINHARNAQSGTSAGAAPAGLLHTAEVATDNLAQKCHVDRRDMRSAEYIENVSSGRADSSASDFFG